VFEARPPAVLLLGIAAACALAVAHAGEVRARSSEALGRGVPEREAALARGFVLGEDEGVDAETVENFRRSGLSHLLAVSGQNVALLALLAAPLLAALGIPLRLRLVWLLALIAAYVPIAGAGASIQRAAVMGGLNMLATLAGRRASRMRALALAAALTLAIEPSIAADVGWQLSFAAVVGILLLAPGLRGPLARRLGSGPLARALADVTAMTVAATLATAPLIAHHFDRLSLTTLAANVLAAPAVAPAMWLGMVAAALGQVPGVPVEAINALNSLLLAYVAQVASWLGRPSWACVEVHLSWTGLVATYAVVALAGAAVLRRRRRLRLVALRRGPNSGACGSPSNRPWCRRAPAAALLALALAAAAMGVRGEARGGAKLGHGLRVSVLDVGQGDAILFQPPAAPPVLVDGGPPGDALASKLRDAGVEGLGAAVVTHDQSDHAGGIREIFGAIPIGRLGYARLSPETLAAARAARTEPLRLASGEELRSGALRLDVLWPPPELLRAPGGGDPNALALVMLARWHRFTMLLSADAEAATTPIDPGPLDVLKVAHHGSDDPGLDLLLDRTRPALAVVSVGAGNPYGHPTAATLSTLASHGVRVLRTDREGTIALEVGRTSVRVDAGR
jgi:competence protein ComEC